jgi:hypothetical protein
MQPKYIYVSHLENKNIMAAQSSLPGAFFQYAIWKIWQTCPKNLAKLVKFTMKKCQILQKNANSSVQKKIKVQIISITNKLLGIKFLNHLKL